MKFGNNALSPSLRGTGILRVLLLCVSIVEFSAVVGFIAGNSNVLPVIGNGNFHSVTACPNAVKRETGALFCPFIASFGTCVSACASGFVLRHQIAGEIIVISQSGATKLSLNSDAGKVCAIPEATIRKISHA